MRHEAEEKKEKEMKHISELKNAGKGKDCIIIGGGMSAEGFNYNSIPNNMVRIELNFPYAPTFINYQMYYDEAPCKYWDMSESGRITIGFKVWAKRADYYYDFSDFVFGDMGFHALQFADKVLRFKNIYLLGYDYRTNGKTYHWWESESDAEKLSRFKSHSIGKVLPKYKEILWRSNIYNLSTESALTLFEYKPL